ncbi:MAG: S8 family serine peptidase, partial [Thermoplasmata archaeon]|nr:S8 family serine peptidase [Thermoplasmata archaeon]
MNDQEYSLDIDKNSNKIEDFLDNRLSEVYPADLSTSSASERVIILLDSRPTTETVEYFEGIGAEVLDVFQYVDAVGVRMPVNLLVSAAQYPPVKMIYGDEPNKPQLINSVPVINADHNSLSGAGYGNINGKGATIAVIDSGIDGDHVTFSHDNIIAFRDYVFGNSDLDPTDGMASYDYDGDNNHGTMCGGTAAGNGGTTGYKGSAPGAYLVAVATETSYDVALGIEWCINNQNRDFNNDGEPDGPDIITLSMGFGGKVMNNYAEAAVSNGIVFVTSAGNNGPGASTIMSPATSPKVIAVGAIDNSKNIADFSSRGPGPGGITKPDVCAPGVAVVIPAGGYWYYAGGTSISGPMVAGVCALLLQYDPTLTPLEVQEILQDSAEDKGTPGPDNTYGWGITDAVAALDSVLKVRDITASKVVAYEDEEIIFGISTSGDPSMIANYQWDFDGDGEYDTENTEPESVKYKYPKSGEYSIEVKITNTHGKFATGTKDIMIINRAPDAILDIEDDITSYSEDEEVTFNASKSWDTQSDINQLKYYWDFGDGNVSGWRSSPLISHGFYDRGEYTVNLVVKDDDEATDSDEIEVYIENQEPIANAGNDKVIYEDHKVVFNGNLSTDSESDIPTLSYIWNFGDGIISYGILQNHTYKTTISNTTYTVTLKVTDDDGAKSEDSVIVKVMNLPPIVDAGKSKAVSEDEVVEFDGYGNDTFSDRDELEYQWDFGDDKSSRWDDTPQTTHRYTQEDVYI